MTDTETEMLEKLQAAGEARAVAKREYDAKHQELIEVIRETRQRTGLSMRRIAQAAGISFQRVDQIVNHKVLP